MPFLYHRPNYKKVTVRFYRLLHWFKDVLFRGFSLCGAAVCFYKIIATFAQWSNLKDIAVMSWKTYEDRLDGLSGRTAVCRYAGFFAAPAGKRVSAVYAILYFSTFYARTSHGQNLWIGNKVSGNFSGSAFRRLPVRRVWMQLGRFGFPISGNESSVFAVFAIDFNRF